MRLHDICQPLLIYFQRTGELPARLDQLRAVPGFEQLELACPVSRQPYIYNPVGVMTAGQRARVIMYDPAPSHSAGGALVRWAVTVVEPPPGQAPLTDVVPLPESYFSFQLPERGRAR